MPHRAAGPPLPGDPGVLDPLERALLEAVARRSPVRSLTLGPVEGVARLRLGETTTLVSTADQRLEPAVRAFNGPHAVHLLAVERQAEGLLLTLQGDPRREPFHLWARGPDQPD